ncbi:AEC family transporter [Thermococcus aggregans]|uniref:AEC family transporter n=1 Tax=Thermococcus aggregans TaxID=110163 RepID=A0A9E7MX26_THEAG|nr:AEC family transporter [Thermococcus aggregans]USS40455.1 AEC family transporter [Thermococcus aggregans]
MNIYEMLALIGIGLILRRLVKSEIPFIYLNKLASQGLLTFYVFSNVASKDIEYLMEIKVVFLYVFLVIVLSLGASFLYGRFFVQDKKWRGALIILSTYPNTVAMGFPIASLFLDDLTPAIIYANTNTLIVLPIVTFVAAHYSSGKASLRESLLRALKFPPTTANLLALSFVLLGIKLPSGLLSCMNKIGWWSIPAILIYFGSRINLQKFEWRKLLEVGTFRIVLPFVFVASTLRADPEIFYAVLVEASMPPAIMANAILAHYKLKEEEGIGVTIVLTLAVLALFLALRLFL